MIDIKELLLDIACGFKRMFIVIGFLLLGTSMVWGVISAVMTIFGAIEFCWWNIPFWMIVVCLIAGCLGQERD